jgi:hypothetical protein
MERKFGDMFLHRDDDELAMNSNEVLWDKYNVALPMAAGLIREFFLNIQTFADGHPLRNPLFNYDFSGILKIQQPPTEYTSSLEYQTSYFSARPMPSAPIGNPFTAPGGVPLGMPLGTPNGITLPDTPPPMPHPSITPTPHPSHIDGQAPYSKPAPMPHPSLMQEQDGEPTNKKKNKR